MKRIILAALLSTVFSAPALADKYEFDKSHTKILFFINHLGFSDTVGEFTTYDGNFTFDQAKPEASTVDVTLKPSGIRTSSPALDQHLQAAEYFNSEKFPDIRFVSKSIKVTGPNTGEVLADVTMLGVTKPVTLKVTFNKADYHPFTQAYVAGFRAEATLKRSDFGMTASIPAVGDEVKILVNTEGTSLDKKKTDAIKKN